MKKEDMSCIDCAVKNCSKMDKTHPDFCLTTHMDEEVVEIEIERLHDLKIIHLKFRLTVRYMLDEEAINVIA